MGAFGTLLFFRFDKQWKQVLTGIVDILGTGGIGVVSANYLKIPREQMGGPILAMLISIIIAVVLAFEWLASILKKENDEIPIRKLDIILGYDKFLPKYYEHRDQQLVTSEFEKQKKELENKEEKLDRVKQELDEQLKNAVYICLPENVRIPVTNRFLKLLPTYIDHICKFIRNTNNLTNQVLEKISENRAENEDIIKGYFAGIGMYVSNDLFGLTGDNDEVRTHFRIYKDGKHTQYSVVMGNKPTHDKIHDIPAGSGTLIRKSYELKTSVIASLNDDAVYDVNTEWGDFMTISYYKFTKDDEPFLNMGISIKNREQFEELLMFLNFYRIERHLQKCVEKINEKCDIINTLR